MSKYPAVYILTNPAKTVLYTGVTSDLERRMQEHRKGTGSEFARRYHCIHLVHYETADSMEQAILEEKRIKAGSRKRKIELIERLNPQWHELSENWMI